MERLIMIVGKVLESLKKTSQNKAPMPQKRVEWYETMWQKAIFM